MFKLTGDSKQSVDVDWTDYGSLFFVLAVRAWQPVQYVLPFFFSPHSVTWDKLHLHHNLEME